MARTAGLSRAPALAASQCAYAQFYFAPSKIVEPAVLILLKKQTIRFNKIILTRMSRMARTAGFEPATVRLEGGCSIQLSYALAVGISKLLLKYNKTRNNGR